MAASSKPDADSACKVMQIQSYQRAIHYAKKNGNGSAVASLLVNLGQTLLDVGNVAEAIEHWDESLSILHTLGEEGNIMYELYAKIADAWGRLGAASDKSDQQIATQRADCQLGNTAPMSPTAAAAFETVVVMDDAVSTNAATRFATREEDPSALSTIAESPPAETQDATPLVSHQPKSRRGRAGSEMKAWTEEEDNKLKAYVKVYGPRWRTISRLFPDRTEAMCRNRYGRMEALNRTDLSSWRPAVNRCNKCGQIKKGHTCTVTGNQRGRGPNFTATTMVAAPPPQTMTPHTLPAADHSGPTDVEDRHIASESLVTLSVNP